MSAPATAGPYAVFADDRSVIVSTADGSTRIARMLSANGADLANAHLFTAAPELRDALAQCLSLIDDMSRFVGQMALRDYLLLNEAPINARTALAKAEGRA